MIVIDAANLGESPGTWRRFSLAEANLVQQAQMNGTLHDAGFAEAVALGAALDILPPEIIVYGVQPEVIEWEMGLSTAVQAAVPEICQEIQAELREA